MPVNACAYDFHLRPAVASDRQLLDAMLYEAAQWRPGQLREPMEIVLARADIARYVQGWGRNGDTGVVAVDRCGRALGAAWYRLFTDQDHGYGYVDSQTPEITIGVHADARRRGVGKSLLTELAHRAKYEGHSALSLSVEYDNPARLLYESMGYTRAGGDDHAPTLRLALI